MTGPHTTIPLIRELTEGLAQALAVIEANWEVIYPLMEEDEHKQHDEANEAHAHGMAYLSALSMKGDNA